jgi:predicted lipoprotein with Yx(FWY)xxD motif
MSARLLFAAAAAATLAAAGCSSSGSDNGSGGESSRPAGGSNTVTTISVKNDRLTGSDGKTLYYNTVDTAQKIQCLSDCASEWPPLTGQPSVGSGLDDEDFATAARPDGTMQVTFYGHPLYEFDEDGPGDTKGQGIQDEGGHWVVATPEQAENGGGASDTGSSGGGYGGGGY